MLRTTLLALLALSLVATPAPAWEWPSFGGDSKAEQVGTREWWKKNKKRAIHVPHKGYQVPGVDGYFGGDGAPMTASVDERTIQLDRPEDADGGLLPGLDPKRAYANIREATGYGPDQAVAEALFTEGVDLMEAKNYETAAVKFEAAANRWPDTDLAAKSLFNLGECYFFQNDYKEASDAYVMLLDKHPNTPKLDSTIERLWSIAQYWEQNYFGESWHAPLDYRPLATTVPKLDTIGHAVRMYDAIRLNDPTGPRADDAIMATAGIHFRRLQYSDADYHYTLLREEYPRSDHQFEAHLLGLKAKMLRYRGPQYDGTALREAKRLEEMTRVNFSGRLSDEERQRLTEMRAQIARAIEERDLQMASYYEGTEHNGAAKYYLNRVIQEHPDTPAAEQAREKMTQLEGLPDTPDVPMEWLVEMFPANKKFESVDSVEMVAPATSTPPGSGQTMVAEGPNPNGPTTTR